MAFRVGMKVVCVKRGRWTDEENTLYEQTRFPERGEVYEVAGIQDDPDFTSLRLKGFPAPWTFDAACFRPVVSTNTDTGMAILENIRRDVTNKILRPIFEDEQA